MGPSVISPSSSPTVNSKNPSSVNTQNYIVPFVAMNKTEKTFDVLDHQNTPERYLHQIDAHISFAMGEQSLDRVAYIQWHKWTMAYIQCSLSGIALSWFLQLHEKYEKNELSAFESAFKKQFFSKKTAHYAQVETQTLMEKETENVHFFDLKVQQIVERGYCHESAAAINLKCDEIFTRGLTKTKRLCSKTAS